MNVVDTLPELYYEQPEVVESEKSRSSKALDSVPIQTFDVTMNPTPDFNSPNNM